MKVLITGATGLIGSQIVSLCQQENIAVNYLTTSKEKLENQDYYKGFYWNPEEGKIDESCFEGVTKIIHLVGASVAKRWTKKQKEIILSSRLATTQLLIDTLKGIEHNIEHVISASAIGIYPSDFQKLYHEDQHPIADNFLGEVVEKWEAAVDGFEQLGIDVAKIRIGLVLSKNGGALEKIAKPVRYGVGAPLGSGKQWQSWIHIEDLASIFLFVAKNRLEGVYNGVAPNPVTNQELTSQIAKVLNKPLWLPNVPEFALKLALGEMATIVLGSQLVSNNKIDSQRFLYKFTHIKPALEDLL
jgi:hypothetical protein